MDKLVRLINIGSLGILLSLPNCTTQKEYYSVNDFQSVEKIDMHVHFRIDDAGFIQQSAEDNFKLLNINNSSPFAPPIEEQQKIAIKFLTRFPDRIAYATTFSVKNWGKDTWLSETLSYLKNSFSSGAIAVKIWKNIGIDLQDTTGKRVMIDDPRFDPVLDYLAKNHYPVIGHLGDSKNSWLPLEKMTVNSTRVYDSLHPQYHMFLYPELPSYEEHIAARDRMLEKHPDLIFIGAHLGSLEWSVDELAKRLDRFPNMAVDMAERIAHFQYQAITNWQKVHDFFIKYQDRILYGTDIIADSSKTPSALKEHAHLLRLNDWKFLVTNESLSSRQVTGTFKGLKLPRTVVDKIYRKNAEKWLPGITKSNN